MDQPKSLISLDKCKRSIPTKPVEQTISPWKPDAVRKECKEQVKDGTHLV